MMNPLLLEQRAKAFDYLFDAVVVTDLHGIIIDWNKGSEALYGYTKKQAIGKPVNILHTPEDFDRISSEVLTAVNQYGKWTGEIKMLHKNGDIGWIESMCVPIYDEHQQVVGALGINRDISARKKAVEKLEQQAYFDHLTKIPNRYLLLDRLEHLIAQSERNKSTFALLFIDLDHFKKINEGIGHVYGDKVLIETANRLKNAIRNSDTVARIGGDEFVILLENISDKNDVSAMLSTLLGAFENTFSIDDKKIDVRCGIGMSTYPADGTTIDVLLSTADKAMYEFKHKNRVRG